MNSKVTVFLEADNEIAINCFEQFCKERDWSISLREPGRSVYHVKSWYGTSFLVYVKQFSDEQTELSEEEIEHIAVEEKVSEEVKQIAFVYDKDTGDMDFMTLNDLGISIDFDDEDDDDQ